MKESGQLELCRRALCISDGLVERPHLYACSEHIRTNNARVRGLACSKSLNCAVARINATIDHTYESRSTNLQFLTGHDQCQLERHVRISGD